MTKYQTRLTGLRKYLEHPNGCTKTTLLAVIDLLITGDREPRGIRWTAKQKDVLRKMKRAKKTAQEISERVGKPRKAVENMIARMRSLGEL